MQPFRLIAAGASIGLIIGSIIAMVIGDDTLSMLCGVLAVIAAIVAAGDRYEYGKTNGKYDLVDED